VPAAARAWSLPVAAPLLGAAALAGVYPALAGRARTPAARAALGLLGAWWLALAEPVTGRTLLLGADDRPAGWAQDAGLAAERLVGPALSGGTLLAGAVWALAAVLLPVVVRGRSTALDLLGATAWAGAVTAGTAAVADVLGRPEPAGLAAAALMAGLAALAGARVGPATSSHTWGMGDDGSTAAGKG
jgi:hypothetical protein